jgi:hypothetical protein
MSYLFNIVNSNHVRKLTDKKQRKKEILTVSEIKKAASTAYGKLTLLKGQKNANLFIPERFYRTLYRGFSGRIQTEYQTDKRGYAKSQKSS